MNYSNQKKDLRGNELNLDSINWVLQCCDMAANGYIFSLTKNMYIYNPRLVGSMIEYLILRFKSGKIVYNYHFIQKITTGNIHNEEMYNISEYECCSSIAFDDIDEQEYNCNYVQENIFKRVKVAENSLKNILKTDKSNCIEKSPTRLDTVDAKNDDDEQMRRQKLIGWDLEYNGIRDYDKYDLEYCENSWRKSLQIIGRNARNRCDDEQINRKPIGWDLEISQSCDYDEDDSDNCDILRRKVSHIKNRKTRNRYNSEQIKEITAVADMLHNKELTRKTAIALLASKGINENSATIYITGYRRMREGKSFDATANREIVDSFLTKIKKEYRSAACEIAIDSVKKHLINTPNRKLDDVLISHWLNC